MIGPYEMDKIYTGDARELSKEIPDNSIDLIFTDPPYLKEYLSLYDELFKISARILKPTGFLLTYVGGYWKDDVMAYARQYLKFFWDYCVWEPFNSPVNWPRKTIARHKSILAYTPKGGTGLPVTQVLSVWLGGGEDKRFHVWGQDESEARYYIDCFSRRGDIVLDICAGGGTTPAICKLLGRSFVAFEIDPTQADISRERLKGIIPFPIMEQERKQPMLYEETANV